MPEIVALSTTALLEASAVLRQGLRDGAPVEATYAAVQAEIHRRNARGIRR